MQSRVRTHHRQLQLAFRLEEDVAGDRADEVRSRSQPGFVVELVEERERLLDSARQSLPG